MKKNDPKYTDFLLGIYDDIKNSNIYQMAENGILGGFSIGEKKYEIYNNWVKTILHWKLLPKHEQELKNIEINALHYQLCFAKGYDRGQKYFIDKYENDPRETMETLVKNIVHLHQKVRKSLNTIALILNDKIFDNYGYYSGILTEM